MKILLLEGGSSPERSVSLRSSVAVKKALEELRIPYSSFDTSNPWSELDKLVDHETMVFPILHGAGGEDGTIQSKLELLNVPYLGSDSAVSKICFDKVLTHEKLETLGISMPRYMLADDSALEHVYDSFPEGFVAKPRDGGSSVDTLVVRGKPDTQTKERWRNLCKLHGTMLFEEVIVGTEITCAILEDEPLPVVLIQPPENEEFNYENKYNGRTADICPVPDELLGNELQEQAQQLALKVHRSLGARHLSRTDIIIQNGTNELYVLELNTIPGLTEASLLPKAAAAAGMSMAVLVENFVRMVKEG